MCAQLHDEIYINKVGTYGIASAQWYWGRMAALILRLIYLVFPEIPWGFVFVDDYALILPEDESELLTTAIYIFLMAVGAPLAWHKSGLGPTNVWLGFTIAIQARYHAVAPINRKT